MLEGVPVKLLVAVLFATVIASIALRIVGRQTHSFAANANRLLLVVTAIFPHVFAEGTLLQIRFATNAVKGACCTSFAAKSVGRRTAGALGLTLPAAKLCCATLRFEVLQRAPVKLLVAVLFAAMIANIALRIVGRQADSFATNANTFLLVVPAIVPHVFAEGTLCHIGFASNAMKCGFCTGFAAKRF